jgi:parvulin-like peptidyl-prolyl isomerase
MSKNSIVAITVVFVAFLLFCCENKNATPAQPSPLKAEDKTAQTSKIESKKEQHKATMPELLTPEDPNEACGQVIVVAWRGAQHASDAVTRDKEQAKTRANELLHQAKQNPDFGSLAKQNSDASSSGPRGGFMGAYERQKWPDVHMPIRDAIFSLKVNQIADTLIEAPYGFVIAKRCLEEKVPARHILIRYKGAKNASEKITRSRDEAKKLADEIYQDVTKKGADFAEIARKRSEDSSAERGGDIGAPARGQLAMPFEEALFSMRPGELRGGIETEFGFHVIQRLEKP